MYTIPEACLPRISHENSSNARSLSDDNDAEVFNFDNLPDGIPLEDPLYDNLRSKDNKEYVIIEEYDENNNIKKIDESASNLNRSELDQLMDDEDLIQKNPSSINSNENKRNSEDNSEKAKDLVKANEIVATKYDSKLNEPTHEDMETDQKTENENQFSNFHVINRETDLEFPPGVEGPIPSVVLPPQNFNGNMERGLLIFKLIHFATRISPFEPT